VPRFIAVLVALVASLALAPAALADATIGSTTPPSGSSPGSIPPSDVFIAPGTDDPGVPYRVPAGGGKITSWSVNVNGATVGTPVSLLVLRPSGGSFLVVARNDQTLPAPLPVDGVATFSLTTAVPVEPNDIIARYVRSGETTTQFFQGGTPAPSSNLVSGPAPDPAPDQTLTVSSGPDGASPPGYRLNLSAVVAPNPQDLSLSQSAAPSQIELGNIAQFVMEVHNSGGLGTAFGTVSDTVPSGLSVLSASTSSGPCSIAGQAVSCPVSVPSGGGSTVYITVRPTSAGTATNSASVASTGTDPNSANNSASAGLTVVPARVGDGPFICLVPSLKGLPLATAKRILKLVKCRAGKVKSAPSRKLRKGSVISTKPGAGAKLKVNAKVAITVSSGPPKKK
jgi:uncharacterized repeat protein (TIGR01451 family)